MTLHRSLKTSSRLMKHRNVLKKRERIQRLVEEERWEEEGASAFNLPKVRNIKIRKGKGKPKEEKEAAAVAEEGAVEAAAESEEQAETPS